MLHDVATSELADLCGVINAAHGRMVEVVSEALTTEVWAGAGIMSPRHWVTWQTGLADRAGGDVVRLAQRREELPTTITALCEGRISLASAGLIARFVPAEYEQCALEFALVMTYRQLRRSVSQYHFDLDRPDRDRDRDPDSEADSASGSDSAPDSGSASGSGSDSGSALDSGPDSGSDHGSDSDLASSAEPDSALGSDPVSDPDSGADAMQGGRRLRSGSPVEERRDLSTGVDDDTFWLSTHLPVDEGAVVRAALEARRDALYRQACEGLPADAPRPKVSLADALVSMAESVLAGGAAVMPGTDRFLIHAHLTANPAGRNDLQLHLGASLPHHLRHLYTCDGTVRPTLETNGTPVSVGRLHRIVSRRLRRLIEHRDGGCAVPGCERASGLEVHHIVHWEHGGSTNTDNLLTLCRHHHRTHHLGLLGIEGNADLPRTDPDGVTFTNRWGKPLALSATPAPPPRGEPVRSGADRLGLHPQIYDHALGERLDYWGVHFTHNRDMPQPAYAPKVVGYESGRRAVRLRRT